MSGQTHDARCPPAPLLDVIANHRMVSITTEGLKARIVALSREWRELDRSFSVSRLPQKSKLSSRCAISIPKRCDLGNIGDLRDPAVLAGCHFDGLAESDKSEYATRLAAIFSEVQALSGAVNASLGAADDQGLSRYVSEHPDLATPFHPAPKATEAIYTFGLLDVRSKCLQQRVQVLASHTLDDLRRTIHCAQDGVKYDPPRSSFFFIESCFYEERGAGHSVVQDVLRFLKPEPPPPIVVPVLVPHSTTDPIPTTAAPANLSAAERKKYTANVNAALAQALLARMNSAPALPVYAKQKKARTSKASIATSSAAPQIEEDETATQISALPVLPSSVTIPPPPRPPVSSPFGPIDADKLCVVDMNSLPISALPLRRGEMYLFCHQHHCEHLVCLLDIQQPQSRLLQLFDDIPPAAHLSDRDPDPSPYPREDYRATLKARKCEICNALSAELLVYHDRLSAAHGASHTIANFFCKSCFQMLHYGVDGEPLEGALDDLVVYPFLHYSG